MIRIGDFARLARVSVRALRHYEAEGLLRPAHVNTRSRYRYYDLQQLETLERLLLLRELGLSLAEIRALLGVPASDLRAAIARHKASLSRQLEEQQRLLARVGALECWLDSETTRSGSTITGSVVRTKSFAEVRALCVRAIVAAGSSAVTEMFEHTERRARRFRTDEAPLLLVHSSRQPAHRLDVEACVPVSCKCRFADVREIDGEPLAASVTYSGPYAGTDELYCRMRSWLSRQQLMLADRPIREIYHRFGADQVGYRLPEHRVSPNGQSFVTELAIPVTRTL